MEELFEQLLQKKRDYTDFGMIMTNYDKFDNYLKEQEKIRLKAYLERNYKETKITKPTFMKIMNFYINDYK